MSKMEKCQYISTNELIQICNLSRVYFKRETQEVEIN